MDLLEESVKKNKKSKGQKVVLALLIISIILMIAIIVAMYFMGGFKPQYDYTVVVNGKTLSKNSIGVIEKEDGSKYISIKDLCKQLDFKYYNGEFKANGEEKNKGYINNGMNIIQFFGNSNKIYKTTEDSKKDKEYYQLDNIIIFENDTLFINIDDIMVGLNLLIRHSEEKNQTSIMTIETWKTQNLEKFEALGFEFPELTDNDNAISYGLVVVKNNDKYGVVSLSGEEIIGHKYNSMTFSEITSSFIVSNSNNKFGSIDTEGKTKIELQYDELEVINHDPLLYKVKSVDKYGILREDGSLINEINYTSIGYPEDLANNIAYTLIIPKQNENIPDSIVVSKDDKYGLIELETGKEIVPCSLTGLFLYIDVEKDVKEYVVKFEDESINTLSNYINILNQITVNVNG